MSYVLMVCYQVNRRSRDNDRRQIDPRNSPQRRTPLVGLGHCGTRRSDAKKPLHSLAGQSKDREDAEHGTKWEERALDAGHNENEPVALPALDEACGHDRGNRHRLTRQEHEASNARKQPSDSLRWWLLSGFGVEEVRRENHRQPNSEVNEGEARKEGGQAADDVVKDRQQSEMLRVSGIWTWGIHGLTRIRSAIAGNKRKRVNGDTDASQRASRPFTTP